ncbi:hypothetical protein HGRIS_003232 [Hohenbuehelia grisea]|uniref:Uncharacterized protein n=1 Tax=Hohenbuehelia grisea TaxID=104357 RepID=A0ABR3JMU1_9AGAR
MMLTVKNATLGLPPTGSHAFSLRINQYKKGPLVSEKKDILAQARDQDIQRVWDTGATPSTALTTTSIRLASIGTTAITSSSMRTSWMSSSSKPARTPPSRLRR